MMTIYLRFTDREESRAQLSAVLGYAPDTGPDGRELVTAGWLNGVRYDLDFLADTGARIDPSEDHVNLLWWGDEATAPDFGAAAVTPATPTCGFTV